MSIVVVNVSQTSAPAPSQQQKKGAFISQGGTTLGANTISLLTGPADLAAIVKPAAAISAITWLSSVVTVTTTAPHGIPNGETVGVIIAGVTPVAYNGSFQATSTGASSFTYPLVSNPGAESVLGTYRIGSAAELENMNTSFWARGTATAVWVLELGLADIATGVAALSTYIDNNTIKNIPPFYAYLPPAGWAGNANFLTLAATKSGLTGRTYFAAQMSLGNYTTFPPSSKAVLGLIPAPAAPTTEFTAANMFQAMLDYTPSGSNKVTQFDNKFMVGVTPYPESGNAPTIAAILAANVNLISTGAEGGLTNLILDDGTTMDGRDFTYWYSVDWVQFNVKQNIAAAVIAGSNNGVNPLQYNQQGIQTVQGVAATTMAQGVTFGLVLGPPIQVSMSPSDFAAAVNAGTFAGQTAVNAQDFLSYSLANPNDYAAGLYTGLAIAYTPARGFKQIVVNIDVTDFVSS